MNKKKKLTLQIVVLILILLSLFLQYQLFFSWESAYRHLETYEHFGPASEIHTLNDSGDRYILAKYDRWISIFYIYEQYGFFYRPGFMTDSLEIDKEADISLQTSVVHFNEREYLVYAYAKDPITTLEVVRGDGSTITLEPLTDHIHIGYWLWESVEVNPELEITIVRGYDQEGELVYEEEIQ